MTQLASFWFLEVREFTFLLAKFGPIIKDWKELLNQLTDLFVIYKHFSWCEIQQFYLVKNKILKKGESTVLMEGSICGVDLNRFKLSKKKRDEIREKYGIKKW